MMTTLRKSALRPLLSVSVPWSMTCSRMLKMSGWAFSILVEQQDAVGLLGHGLGQLAALVVADVARWRADQPRDGVAFHVFRHVEAQQLDTHAVGELLGDFGLADAGRAGEQEGADRFAWIAEAGAGHLDRLGQRVDGGVLAEDHVLQVAVEVLQAAAIVGRHMRRRDARDLGDDLLDVRLPIVFFCFDFGRMRCGTRLVDDVDRLVRQVAVIDEADREFDGRGQCRRPSI